MKIVLLPILMWALCASAFATNHAVVMGGCASNKDNEKEFEQEAKFTHDGFKAAGWKASMVYGEGFDKDAIDKALDPQNFKKGDQLFLSLSTHGDQGPPHMICLGNPDGTSKLISVDKIQPLLEKLSSKEVKVTVVDNSCFSGGSIKGLAGKNVCVVAATYDNVPSFTPSIVTSMTGRLLAREAKRGNAKAKAVLAQNRNKVGIDLSALGKDDMEFDGKKGTSMEELFLSSRSYRGIKADDVIADKYSPAQISSDVGEGGYRLKDVFPAYFDFFAMRDKKSTLAKTDAVLKRDYFSDGATCDPENPFHPFVEFSNNMDKITNKDKVLALAQSLGFNDIADVRVQMKNYLETRKKVWSKWKAARNDHETAMNNIKDTPIVEFLVLKDKKAKYEMALAGTEDSDKKAELTRKLASLETNYHLSDMENSIMSDPKLKGLYTAYSTASTNYLDAQGEDAQTSGAVAYPKLEAVFYEAQYLAQREKTNTDDKAKACSDFTL